VILRVLETLGRRSAQYEKPSGLTSTLFYYLKWAFQLLFMNGPPNEHAENPQTSQQLNNPLTRAVYLLETAAAMHNPDALFLLAEMDFYGNFTHPRNYVASFKYYSDLALLKGNSSAQHMVGFMYATGIGGAVERDQGKALLYHTYAALGGNTRSEMTVAFRHHTGIGTPRSCDDAAQYYKRVADKAIAYVRSGPPGGQMMIREAHRWADEHGGVYGEGASVSSSGINANRDAPHSNTHAALEDVLEYLDLMSRKGDFKATLSLGKLHYEGSRAMKRNVRKAKKYFMSVARKYWAKDGRVISGGPSGIEKTASRAAGYIGRMFLRGEGTEASFEKATTWFRRGVANGDALCQYEMGLMHLQGLGFPKDAHKAASYFKAAAEEDFPAAQYHLGALFLDQGEIQTAIRYFELAARHGYVEAYYFLAEIYNQGIGKERHCGMATYYYKLVSERAEAVHTSVNEANYAYEIGDLETALVDSMMAAEQGYESSQANVAYLLDQQKSIIPLRSYLPWREYRPPILRNAALALIYWTRSSKQNNFDSTVKLGDYYLAGFGTEQDYDKASACYSAAAEGHHSAQALWNLGWMHENGVGVGQDFHMAKRYYDLSLETNEEAYLPVKLSLIKLRMRSFWNTITHGRVKSIQTEEEPKKEWKSFSEWINAFLEDYDRDLDQEGYNGEYGEEFERGPANVNDPMPGGDDYYDDMDEGLIESLIIIGLAATLAFLVYYRQQRQMNGRADGQNQVVEGQQVPGQGVAMGQAGQGQPLQGGGGVADRGLFPNPGDPDFNQWVAGGVGH
jgi:SEL1 protein